MTLLCSWLVLLRCCRVGGLENGYVLRNSKLELHVKMNNEAILHVVVWYDTSTVGYNCLGFLNSRKLMSEHFPSFHLIYKVNERK